MIKYFYRLSKSGVVEAPIGYYVEKMRFPKITKYYVEHMTYNTEIPERFLETFSYSSELINLEGYLEGEKHSRCCKKLWEF